jgi:hypothetical protein
MAGLRRFLNVGLGVVCLVVTIHGCRSSERPASKSRTCADIEQGIDFSHRIETLNLLSAASAVPCDELLVTFGVRARNQFRHKAFSITGEAANVFVPDGTFIEYVLESYERGYLSILVAASYLRKDQPEAVKVELRELDHELFTPLYNYGEDPVNLLLSAALWEQLGDTGEARVDWLRLRDMPRTGKQWDDSLHQFAGERIGEIDRGEGAGSGWHIYRLGRFPDVDWDLTFTNSTSGYFSITPRQPFMASCVSATGLRISTESWFNKLAIRHSHAYHPLLNVQTWIRLPFGVFYSLIPFTAGAGVMVGGCAVDVAAEGRGALCRLSVVGGMAIMSTAPHVLEGSLRPDLRHWENVPAAVVVTRASEPNREPCLANVKTDVQRML